MSTMDKVKNALHLNKDHTTSTHHSGTAERVDGPQNSRVANTVDPRIDSDNSRTAGSTTGTTGGYTGTGTGVTGTGSTNAGPHNSNLANKLDPGVDSDRNMGAATGTAGTTGTHIGNNTGGYTGDVGGMSNSTNAGPHNSNIANKLDPRVDSDLDGRGNRHGAATGGIMGISGSHATPGSGTAQNTAGPHNDDVLNKIDPRVDSNADGSRTYGGNKTHT